MHTFRNIFGFIGSSITVVLTLPVLVIGFPFWLMGFLQKASFHGLRFSQSVSVKLRQKVNPIPNTWYILDSLMQYEPVIGWKPKPNLKTNARDKRGNKYRLTTDETGWRKVSHNGLDDFDVYVFGDSFAFGFGVNDQDFFPNILSTPRIRSIGTNGYSLVQELLLMEQYESSLSGKTVIWFIYHGNDLYENLRPNRSHYRMPFVREDSGTGKWEIVSKHVNSEPWTIDKDFKYRQKLAEICSDTPLARRAFAACDYLIERGKKICDRQKATLIVFSQPDIAQMDKIRMSKLAALSPDKLSFDVNKPDRELKKICDKYAVPFYSMKYYLKTGDYLEGDSHWNKSGNRTVAELIRDLHVQYNSLQKPAETSTFAE